MCLGNSSDGNRDYVPGLCRAAAGLGVDNYFLEVHPDPDNAPSDGPNMVELTKFEWIVQSIKEIRELSSNLTNTRWFHEAG